MKTFNPHKWQTPNLCQPLPSMNITCPSITQYNKTWHPTICNMNVRSKELAWTFQKLMLPLTGDHLQQMPDGRVQCNVANFRCSPACCFTHKWLASKWQEAFLFCYPYQRTTIAHTLKNLIETGEQLSESVRECLCYDCITIIKLKYKESA